MESFKNLTSSREVVIIESRDVSVEAFAVPLYL